MVAQGGADLLAHAAHVFQLDVAVASARGSHADQKQIGPPDSDCGIRARRQPAGCDLPFDDPADVFFDDGAFARVDEIDLCRLRIDADDFMTLLGQASRRNGPDVSQTPDAKLHDRPCDGCTNRPARPAGAARAKREATHGPQCALRLREPRSQDREELLTPVR